MDDSKVIEVDDRQVMKIEGDFFELSVRSGTPTLSKLPVWKKYSLTEPFFVRNLHDGQVVISAYGKDDITMNQLVFEKYVTPLFDSPTEFIGFHPADENTITESVCTECNADLSEKRVVVCEVCGKQLCSHCIIKSQYNRFRQNLCPECYCQKRNMAVTLDV